MIEKYLLLKVASKKYNNKKIYLINKLYLNFKIWIINKKKNIILRV